jgi:hypothetical protein
MPKRPITALAAALALLVATPAAHAQDPPADASPEVQHIYQDYRNDGRIEVCDHERADLQDALDTIEPDFDSDFPDFRAALEAGIERHENGRCDAGSEEPSPTPTASATPEGGDLPEEGGGIPPDDGALPPPDDGSAPPLEEGTPPPEPTHEAAPPVPTTAAPPPTAAVTPAATPASVVVTRSRADELRIPLILLGIAVLGAALLAASAFAAQRSPRVRHAWQEAAFRTRGTWADFSDWLRFGR